jgi:predicted AlkP superfamily pyrophosphatase or phosphodiesterase
MRIRTILTVFIFFVCTARAGAIERPVPAISHVLIVSIDGLRPDLALRADAPTIHGLLKISAFTFWARTTAESVTLPSHTSMLTGVVPIRHTIQWNMDLPLLHPVYPAYPTLFELARSAGYTTAMAAGKNKFTALAKPGTLNWQYIPDSTTSEDPQVTQHALEIIRDHRPDLMFVHLPSVDNVGHAAGWASGAQIAAIERADACVGQILSAYDELSLRNSTLAIITSDHGGAGLSHGPDDPRSRHIPWIVSGPGIRAGLDLTIYDRLTVDTEETFCTACYVLGIQPRRLPLDGKPVMEIFDRTGQELIRNQ